MEIETSQNCDQKNEVKISEIEIPSIMDSIPSQEITEFAPYYKSFYQEKYCTKFTSNVRNLDLCIKIHTNKVCVVYLSPKHSLFQNRQRIKKLNFQITNTLNRLQNEISGKRKAGAQYLKTDSILCYLETEDDVLYPVHTGIAGRLIEINSELIENPNLIITDNLCDGFLAIILPDLKNFDVNVAALVKTDDYNK